MSTFKIGMTSVTFRNKTIEEIVEICKKEQVEYIEWGSDVHVKTKDDAKKAKQLCDDAGIKISSYGSYYSVGSNNRDEWTLLCENASIMGAESIRVWLGKKDSEKTSAEEYENILNDCKFLCDEAKEYGIIVSPECHDDTFNNNTDAILRFIKELNRDNFRTYFQSRYFRMEYDLDRIDRTFDFILNMHVSYSDLKREQMFRKKDKNYLDKLLKKMISKNFNGIVILEFTENSSEKAFSEDIKKLKTY
ncbi:MAG: sugar phosphate isomerase/epimerase [Clostridia bacterium]|nr:sugar phosphate isomerase/epimerase [Clostridia bacterium]